MTQFISSFLIEPVVRQARRFSSSRPSLASNDGEPLPRRDDLFPDYHDAVEPSAEDAFAAPDLDSQSSQRHRHRRRRRSRASRHRRPDGAAADQIATDGRRPADRSSNPTIQQARHHYPASGADGDEPRTRAETDPHPQSSTAGQNLASRPRFRSANASHATSINEAGLISTGFATGNHTIHTDRSNMPNSNMSSSPPPGDGILPEDDGMGFMRRRILEIQKMDTSAGEKSKLMHSLMVEQYSLAQNAHSPNGLRPRSPGSFKSQERPLTPSSAHSNLDVSQATSPLTSRSSVMDENQLLTTNDLKPTFWEPPEPKSRHSTANPSPEESRKNSLDEGDEERPFGCQHYKRNVKLQCFTCSRWYTCRFCHDEVEDHMLNRRETRNMLCMFCGSAQAAAGYCKDCGEVAACYYCNICKLWDNDPSKSIYHCDDCGICRVGKGLGKDFYHCKTCNVCLSIAIRDTHRCIERSTDCDCPICGEYMFTSPQTVVFMRCGHSIHQTCYKEHAQNSYKCPICSKSIVNMEMTFRHLDRAIEAQPMPPQFQDTRALIYCNDCCAKSSVKYHWLGLKCSVCDSYNTAQIQILSEPSDPTSQSPSGPPTATSPNATNVSSTLPLEDSQMLSSTHAQSRGRSLAASGSQVRRTATSASALESSRNSLLDPWPPIGRSTRASSADNSNMYGRELSRDNSDSDLEAMDTDDDDSVDFWGGESPTAAAGARREIFAVDECSSDESDSDLDMLEDDDEEEEDEDEMEHDLELIGHR